MDLLVFAHRGEAQAFLSQIQFQSVEANGLQLFESEKLDLLVTGEGYLEALKACLLTLARKKYDKVTNLGIAGALNPKLKVSEIVSIRTIYRYFNESPIFKSHTTIDQDAKYDCTSFNKRVLEPQDAKRLSVHADLVDRELWGIAEACKSFDTPLAAYKLISDIAGETQCQLVAEKAVEYTHQLFDNYHERSKLNLQADFDLSEKTTTFIRSLSPTFSQRVQLESLLKKCQLKGLEIDDIYHLDIYEDWPRKRRNQDIIKRLTALVDPIQSKLDSLCQDLSSLHCKAIPHSETPQLEIKARVENREQLDTLVNELKTLPIEKITDFYNGEI